MPSQDENFLKGVSALMLHSGHEDPIIVLFEDCSYKSSRGKLKCTTFGTLMLLSME